MNDENDDKSIVNALSALGWVEEKSEEEEPAETDKSLQEQLELFIKQNGILNEKINSIAKENEILNEERENLLRVIEENKSKLSDSPINIEAVKQKEQIIIEKENLINELEIKIQELSESVEAGGAQIQAVQELKGIIANKDQEINDMKQDKELFSQKSHEWNSEIDKKQQYIQDLFASVNEKKQIIEEQTQKLKELNEINSELNLKIEEISSKSKQSEDLLGKNQNLIENLKDKDNKIKELKEQIIYLQNEIKNDTVQKSKYDKIILLVEKKDEIITNKEKSIFDVENSLNSANQTIFNLQQQLETFNLVKKDLKKKEERNKELVIEIEEKIQRGLANKELIDRLEDKIEYSLKDLAKYELELNNKNFILQDKESENISLIEKIKKLETQLYEGERIEDKILTDLTKIKDEKQNIEAELNEKNKELVELKKKIKLMRRNMSKT